MSQCLHCSKPCAEDAVFCEECQTRSENAFLFVPTDDSLTEDESSPFSTTPLLDGENNASDQAVVRLNAAARWIEEESGGKRLKRSSRLAPLRDISSEIHRASTPHPRTFNRVGHDSQSETDLPAPREDEQVPQNKKSGKIWSWFNIEAEEEEKEGDLWANATDPFIARSRPTIAEAASIEEEDIRRAQFENHTTLPYPSIYQHTRQRQPRRFSIWHLAFGSVVIVAIAALLVDGLLLSFAFNHAKHPAVASGGPPTLTLSTNEANIGATMSVQLTHFAPQTNVALTHDIQEVLTTTANSPTLMVNASGQAQATFQITNSWGPGSHLIVAEDVTTRDTASAILQIGGAGPSRPPHLLLDSESLDLGDGVQGTSTIQPLALHNAGSGSITWSVSSNQPWLLVAPQQGTFGAGQTISVAAQRSSLSPGPYTGTITVSSNVGEPEQIPVTMTVSALPPNAGPVISLSPPLLSFIATDGLTTPETQILTLSNPGQQTLHWSLASGNTIATTIQSAYQQASGQGISLDSYNTAGDASWLSAYPDSGALASGQSIQVSITVRSQSVLPGSYMSMLTFNALQGTQAYDTPQIAGIALTIQPHCGLVTSSGLLSFTAVSGQSNPSPHVLSLNATSSCSDAAVNWKAFPSASWITVNPASGQVKGTTSNFASIGVNTAGLTPKTTRYSGLVTFQTGKDTQTVVVQLTLQPHPAPSVPILGALPLSLNFSVIQGQANPTGQVVTVTNNGGSPLKWRTGVSFLSISSWVAATPSGGTVLPGQTGQLTVNVNTANLTPGTYASEITLMGTDEKGQPASGNPQVITVSLIVQPPCALSRPSASALLFNGIAGGANPTGQAITLVGSGSCAWPLQWNTSVVTSNASWLTLSPSSGTLNSATQRGNLFVGANTNGLAPGTYSAQFKINASDGAGTQAQNTPQSVTVTLTVLQPCTLQQPTTAVAFNASQGQASMPSETLSLTETGSCGGGVAWTATANASSNAWLNLSATSGTDSGSGSSITITASPGNLSPGTYSGQIVLSASNNGMVLQGSPQTIPVTLTISGYTVSGTVSACGGPAPDCSTSQGLGGATVSLLNGDGTTLATVTADSSGNFTFTNIPLGNYSLSVSGSSGGNSYTGTGTTSVNGNTSNVTVQTFPS